jgi:hypothetical protein
MPMASSRSAQRRAQAWLTIAAVGQRNSVIYRIGSSPTGGTPKPPPPSGQSWVLTLWHRLLPAMISAFTTAGFRVTAIDEPLPAPDTPRELLPGFLRDKPSGSGFLCFMFFVLEAG